MWESQVTLDFKKFLSVQKRVICKNKGMYFGFPLVKEEINYFLIIEK
jgi:hypothetical protein